MVLIIGLPLAHHHLSSSHWFIGRNADSPVRYQVMPFSMSRAPQRHPDTHRLTPATPAPYRPIPSSLASGGFYVLHHTENLFYSLFLLFQEVRHISRRSTWVHAASFSFSF
jgi:hypothetical protein